MHVGGPIKYQLETRNRRSCSRFRSCSRPCEELHGPVISNVPPEQQVEVSLTIGDLHNTTSSQHDRFPINSSSFEVRRRPLPGTTVCWVDQLRAVASARFEEETTRRVIRCTFCEPVTWLGKRDLPPGLGTRESGPIKYQLETRIRNRRSCSRFRSCSRPCEELHGPVISNVLPEQQVEVSLTIGDLHNTTSSQHDRFPINSSSFEVRRRPLPGTTVCWVDQLRAVRARGSRGDHETRFAMSRACDTWTVVLISSGIHTAEHQF
ncbi:hypothetical protein quinque_013859 [Culex quinquefasciatus]